MATVHAVATRPKSCMTDGPCAVGLGFPPYQASIIPCVSLCIPFKNIKY